MATDTAIVTIEGDRKPHPSFRMALISLILSDLWSTFRGHDNIQRPVTCLIVSRIWSTQWFRFQWPWVTVNLDFKVTGYDRCPWHIVCAADVWSVCDSQVLITNCLQPFKKSSDHTIICSGMLLLINLFNNTLWSITSNALLKSTNKTLIMFCEQSAATNNSCMTFKRAWVVERPWTLPNWLTSV